MKPALRTTLMLTAIFAAVAFLAWAVADYAPHTPIGPLGAAGTHGLAGFAARMLPGIAALAGLTAAVAAVMVLRDGAEGSGGLAGVLGVIAAVAFLGAGSSASAWKRDSSHLPATPTPFRPPPPPPPPPTPIRPPIPPDYQGWVSPDASFGLAVPAQWRVKPGQGATQTLFDGTTPAGAFSFGDDLLVTRLSGDSDDSTTWDEGCGSHVCGATLTLIRHRHVQLKLRNYRATDGGKSEKQVRKDLESLGEKIATTLW